MKYAAKIFMKNGRQYVQLPEEFRFDCNEVLIRKEPVTGDFVISKKLDSWQDFFEMIDAIDVPEDFLSHRGSEFIEDKDLF
ncbi:antitoxin [Aliikangiella sp. IMCC44632]